VTAIDASALALVQAWVSVRRGIRGLPRAAPLLCTLHGRPVLPSYVRQLLPRLARRAGIDRRVHAHAMRHTFASELAREGVPLPVIQAALGHRHAATTSRYLAHIEPREVIETLRGRT